MIWLLRTMRMRELAIAVLGTAVLTSLMHGRTAPVPSLTAGGLSPVPIAAVLGLVPAGAVLRAWSGLPDSMAAGSVRRLWLHRLGVMLAVAVVTFLAAYPLGGSGGALEATRNALGLCGLAVIGLWLFGRQGGLAVPIGYVLAAFLFGRGRAPNSAAGWAWILRDGGDLLSHVVALAGLMVGMLLLPSLPARLVDRDDEQER